MTVETLRLPADELVGPPWLAQDERPGRVAPIGFGRLPVHLRLLLAHDGTLITTLEAVHLTPVVADVEGQMPTRLDADHARWLRAEPGRPALRRRTVLRERRTGRLLVQAEVRLLPDLLPDGFLDVLAASDKGLGEACRRMGVETRRELLWFGGSALSGLGAADRAQGGRGVVRCYRLIVGSTPVCLIEEHFPAAVHLDPTLR